MRRAATALVLLLAGFTAGAIAMLELVDRLFGGHGVVLGREHRALLDGGPDW